MNSGVEILYCIASSADRRGKRVLVRGGGVENTLWPEAVGYNAAGSEADTEISEWWCWALIEGYWHLGQRILEDSDRMPDKQLIQRVGQSLGRSKTSIYYAVQFAVKYPTYEALRELRDVANITWHKVCSDGLVHSVNAG